MNNKWLVKDLMERIEKQEETVGLHLPWANYYTLVPKDEALVILRRLVPDQRLSVFVSGGILFIG
jgi:hypothetical protein